MKSWLILLVAVVAFAVTGCDDAESVTEVERTPEQEAQMVLEQVAADGQAGSAVGPLLGHIENMKESNPTLAAELEPAANDLMSTMDPKAAKTKAQAMLDKLGGAGEAAPE